jgi:hypothetical protein
VLLEEISAVVGGGPARRHGGVFPAHRHRGRRARVNWASVFSRLPKGTFQARDVRKLAPNVAPGTLSVRLASWVKAKQLKRTGSRRGTKYSKIA